ASEPVLVMSTVPVVVSPGLRPLAVNRAVAGELPIDRVPVAKTLPALAAAEVKFAPEPTVMPTAARTTASAARVRRGCAARACRRFTGRSFELGDGGRRLRRGLSERGRGGAR